MVCDSSDPEFRILNYDELIESVEDNLTVVKVEADMELSASEAFAGLETPLKWNECQNEYDHMQLLTGKWMCDLATRKRIKTVKQLTVTEMLRKYVFHFQYN